MKPQQIPDHEAAEAINSPGPTILSPRDPEPEEEVTSRIWTEAGFLPPLVCREAVELLHLLAMEDETADGDGTALVVGIAMQALTLAESGFHVTDLQKLEDIAIEYGVAVAERDAREIARDVTEMIIAEYGQKPITLTETP